MKFLNNLKSLTGFCIKISLIFLALDDKRRVILSGSSEYINASHVDIDVSTTVLKYVACQTPLRHTVSDFWRMVWEKQACMIITMNHKVEFGAKNGFQSWLDSENKSLKAQ